jgi:hypothetical protein
MTQTAPASTAEKMATYIAKTNTALATANQQLAEKQAAENALAGRAPAIADLLVAQGLIAPTQKQAAVTQLADPVAMQAIICNLLDRQKAAAPAPVVPPVGRGVPEKAASYGAYGATPASGEGLGSGNLFDPVFCGQGRSLNDPVIRRRSESLLKLAGVVRN